MNVLIVCESMFGNTRAAADAVADGLRSEGAAVVVGDVTEVPPAVPDGTDLLVIGGPTHAFSMTRENTRQDALRQVDAPGGGRKASFGIREWIATASPDADVRVVTFDTRVKKAFVPGSAAKSAARALEERGFAHAERGETFWVKDTPGPLLDGELERARAWGQVLARS